MSIMITYLMMLSFSVIEPLQFAGGASYTGSLIINASINPSMYFLTNKQYRCAVKTLFKVTLKKAKNPQNSQLDASNKSNVMERRL